MNIQKRQNGSNVWGILYAVALVFILWAPHAHAYLDPGTGSYIVQILIGAVFGAAYFFKSFFMKLWHSLRSKFKKNPGHKDE